MTPLDPEEIDAIGRLTSATVPVFVAQPSTRVEPTETQRSERGAAHSHDSPIDRCYEAVSTLRLALLRLAGNPVAPRRFSVLSAGSER